MKLFKVFFLLVIFLFIGMSINTPSSFDKGRIDQKDLDNFEEEIINGSGKIVNIEPNTFSSCGKKVEDIIDNGFSFVFKIIKDVINDK